MACTTQVKVTYRKGSPKAYELICSGGCDDGTPCAKTPKDINHEKGKTTRQFCACKDGKESKECHLVLVTEISLKGEEKQYFECKFETACGKKEHCAAYPVDDGKDDDDETTWIKFECGCKPEDEVYPRPK